MLHSSLAFVGETCQMFRFVNQAIWRGNVQRLLLSQRFVPWEKRVYSSVNNNFLRYSSAVAPAKHTSLFLDFYGIPNITAIQQGAQAPEFLPESPEKTQTMSGSVNQCEFIAEHCNTAVQGSNNKVIINIVTNHVTNYFFSGAYLIPATCIGLFILYRLL